MIQAAIGIILVLCVAVGGLWLRLDAVTVRAAGAEQALQSAIDANAAGQQAITALGAEMVIRDGLAAEWRRRHAKSERLAAASAARLEEIERENSDLRAYMDSPVPRPAADWMWLPAAGGDADGSGAGAPARLVAGTDPIARIPVPHRDGWRWCKAVESALDSCNTDKALIRQWADGSVRQQ